MSRGMRAHISRWWIASEFEVRVRFPTLFADFFLLFLLPVRVGDRPVRSFLHGFIPLNELRSGDKSGPILIYHSILNLWRTNRILTSVSFPLHLRRKKTGRKKTPEVFVFWIQNCLMRYAFGIKHHRLILWLKPGDFIRRVDSENGSSDHSGRTESSKTENPFLGIDA